jgi:hypothetical protein
MKSEQLDRIYAELMASSIGQQVYGWCGGAAMRAIIAEVVYSVETIQSEGRIADMKTLREANRPEAR